MDADRQSFEAYVRARTAALSRIAYLLTNDRGPSLARACCTESMTVTCSASSGTGRSAPESGASGRRLARRHHDTCWW
ncbi:hypothetical protein ACWDV4_13565 [Micromonospora sp. NPDC003197]